MENKNIKKKDNAKEKIILFAIGVFVGAVISAVAFFAYIMASGTNSAGGSLRQMSSEGVPPEMPSGQNQDDAPAEMPNYSE